MSKSDNKAKILVIVVSVIVVVGVLVWFILGRRYSTSFQQIDQGNFATPTASRQMAAKEEKMGRVQDEMERVISSWCGAEGGTYGPEDTLKGLWMRKFPTTPKYSPTGINDLINEIRSNDFFGNCNPPHIQFGSFATGGAIQKVGDLNTFLSPCEQT